MENRWCIFFLRELAMTLALSPRQPPFVTSIFRCLLEQNLVEEGLVCVFMCVRVGDRGFIWILLLFTSLLQSHPHDFFHLQVEAAVVVCEGLGKRSFLSQWLDRIEVCVLDTSALKCACNYMANSGGHERLLLLSRLQPVY